jgi:hypothetical protein
MKYFSFKLIKILTSDTYAEQIHKLVKDDTTFNQSYYGPSWSVIDDHGTAHISVVAPNGEFIRQQVCKIYSSLIRGCGGNDIICKYIIRR